MATTDQSAGEAVRASGAGTGDLSSPSSSTCAAKPPSNRSPVLNSLLSTYDHLRKALDTEIDLSTDMLLCGNNLSDASTPGRNTGAQVRPDDEDGRASISRAQSAPSQRVLTVSFTTGSPSETPQEASGERLTQRCQSLGPAQDQQPDATGRPSNTPPEIRQGALRLAADEASISVRIMHTLHTQHTHTLASRLEYLVSLGRAGHQKVSSPPTSSTKPPCSESCPKHLPFRHISQTSLMHA